MRKGETDPAFAGVVHAVTPGASLLRTWRLAGGVSARTTALEVELPDGRREKLVVRQYGQAAAAAKPRVADHELRLLEAVRSAAIPAPRPYHADGSGQILPGPYLVTGFVEGQPPGQAPADVPGLVRWLATTLTRIHGVCLAPHDLSFLRGQQAVFARRIRGKAARLDESLSEGTIRAALRRAWPPQRQNAPVLLHGDFWPGNTLWRRGRLVAVLDWEDAAAGDPLADLANGRLEILMAFGDGAMQAFTRRYRSLMTALDYASLPCWDLCAALRPAGKMSSWGLDPPTLSRLREGHRAFVRQALGALPR